ncbi:MAG TPA: DUF2786 domain-containing protein [Jiangellaceae bacterium]|nr:DUF2786 domain-containing protein [Jiangellaceae bacterium]
MILTSVLSEITAEPALTASYARLFLGPSAPVPAEVMVGAIDNRARTVVATVVRRGWLPSDLAEVASRRLSTDHIAPLAALLSAEMSRHSARVASAWREDLAGLGPAAAMNPPAADLLEFLLELIALLSRLPQIPMLIPPPGGDVTAHGSAAGIDPKLLARVRSLLAKAESTEFPDEAEALSAKAQELISRYALDRLTVTRHETDDHRVTTVRMWIDPPYLRAKASLISNVARANRCRSVVTDDLGFSTVVGEAADVEAVELLATSLLVQASSAMLGHGSVVDRYGTSRTRSFRQSFLVSYASRIGERLLAATEKATAETGRAGELVPLLRRQAERIDQAVEAMFPKLVFGGPAVSNSFGWAAGRAAADLAQLDVRGQVSSGAA